MSPERAAEVTVEVEEIFARLSVLSLRDSPELSIRKGPKLGAAERTAPRWTIEKLPNGRVRRVRRVA